MARGLQLRRRRRVRAGTVRGGAGGVTREAEVDDARAPVLAEQHVVGLEVAVHQARRVRGRQPSPGGDEHIQHLAPVTRASAEPALERSAAQELHGQEHLSVEDADVVHGDDVRVRQPRHRLRLAQQPRARRVLLTLLAPLEQLERDLSIELRIVGAVDDAHRAAADAFDDQIAADTGAGVQRWLLARVGYRLITTDRHRSFMCERPIDRRKGAVRESCTRR